MTQDTAGPVESPKSGGDRHTTAAKMTTAQRTDEALKLRLLGHSFDSIAKRVGWRDKSAAHKAVTRALKNVTRESATELREQELQRLDMAQLAIMANVLQGNLGAVDRLVKIVDQRAKLTGLYENVADSGVDEFKAVLREWRRSLEDDGDLDDEGTETDDHDTPDGDLDAEAAAAAGDR